MPSDTSPPVHTDAVACGELCDAMGRLTVASQPGAAAPAPTPTTDIDGALWERLRPHQREGVVWLYSRLREASGALLGDDMGLGKTVQAMVFAHTALRSGDFHTCLVVAPLSCVATWVRHAADWAPGVTCIDLSPRHSRAAGLQALQRSGGIGIASFGLLDAVGGTAWGCVVVDELHRAKNDATKLYRQLQELRGFRIGLTGTVVQNNLSEMWAVFNWVGRGEPLGDRDTFHAEFTLPVARAQCADATKEERQAGRDKAAALQRMVSPVFLRRTKESLGLLGSVAKADFTVFLQMSPQQKRMYTAHLKACKGRVGLADMVHLRKICNHTWATAQRSAITKAQDEHDPYICNEKDGECPLYGHATGGSAKMAFLASLLADLSARRRSGEAPADKMIIFSLTTTVLDLVEHMMSFGCGGQPPLNHLRVDGSVSVKARDARINAFTSDPNCAVLLLTLRVGGVGITLTAANTVVIVDPDWNPANDSQGVDRAYRIGQNRDVAVYRLVTAGTVEEYVYRRALHKTDVSDAVLQQQATGRHFTEEQVTALSRLPLGECRTADLLHRRLVRAIASTAGLPIRPKSTAVLEADAGGRPNVLAVLDNAQVAALGAAVEQGNGGEESVEAEPTDDLTEQMQRLSLQVRVEGGEGARPAAAADAPLSDGGSDSDSDSSSSDGSSSSGSSEGEGNPLHSLKGGPGALVGYVEGLAAYAALSPTSQQSLDTALSAAVGAEGKDEAGSRLAEVNASLFPDGRSNRISRLLANHF